MEAGEILKRANTDANCNETEKHQGMKTMRSRNVKNNKLIWCFPKREGGWRGGERSFFVSGTHTETVDDLKEIILVEGKQTKKTMGTELMVK